MAISISIQSRSSSTDPKERVQDEKDVQLPTSEKSPSSSMEQVSDTDLDIIAGSFRIEL